MMISKSMSILMIILIAGLSLEFVSPALAPAGSNNKGKNSWLISPLEDNLGESYGEAIYKTKPLGNGDYKLQIKVKEYSLFVNKIVDVKLNGVSIGSINIDGEGSGALVVHLQSYDPSVDIIEVILEDTYGIVQLQTTAGNYFQR